MKTLSSGSTGPQVILLQKLLSSVTGQSLASATFDPQTLQAVKTFQTNNNLVSDGIVGERTWNQLLKNAYSFNLQVKNQLLGNGEYMPEVVTKRVIYLHHTAGRHRPDYTIQAWNSDAPPGEVRRVATAFVIGGQGFDGDTAFDGKTYRAFNEIYWAHHLGLKHPQNTRLNQQSIAIEICAMGALVKTSAGKYRAAAYPDHDIFVPESQVHELETPWRGYQYFQRYTPKQIDECKRLVLTMSVLFDIPLPNITYDTSWFDLKPEALTGAPGLWTHAHVRADKTDCFPQPEFMAMLNSLHEARKTFTVSFDDPRSFHQPAVNDKGLKHLESTVPLSGYSSDLNDVTDTGAP